MSKHSIYYLDDDPDQHTLMQAVANDMGVEFKGFTSVKSFLNDLQNFEQGICFIDLNLNEGESAGFVVIEAIKNKLTRQIPIIILSKRSSSADISYGLDLGADDYIVKPIDSTLIKEKDGLFFNETFRDDFNFAKFANKKLTAVVEMEENLIGRDKSFSF